MKPTAETLFQRGVEEIIVKEHLEKALSANERSKKLRVKFGIDPTSPDMHLGHMVALRKLRQFQDAGHKIILIIGDFTAMIGDPSGRNEQRKPLTAKEVKNNLKKYLAQAGKVLNIKKAEVHYNSKWFKSAEIITKLASAITLHQTIHRSDFKKRLEEGGDVSFLEAMYPLFQGYDSVAVKADLEIGGTDQKFNLLMGRQIQSHFKMPEQDVLMFPLLEGTDGERKMSKSFGNAITFNEKPDDMFGKIMSVPDKLMPKYFELLTDINPIPDKLIKDDPRAAKLLLANSIIAQLHGGKEAKKAEGDFVKVFSKKEKPTNAASLKISGKNLRIVDLIIKAGVKSKSEAWRLVEQGGVSIDGEVKKDPHEEIKIKSGATLKIGKRRFFKIK